MGSMQTPTKPHAVCIPYPAQGHITPMLNLAKLLHSKGFHVTFINTQYNHERLIRSRGPAAVAGLPDFQFKTIPDGLPPPTSAADADATQDIPSLCESVSKNFLLPFREVILEINDSSDSGVPPVTCIVSDGVMSFTLEAAEEFGVPEVLFWTTSACGFLGYTQYKHLVERGLVPLKDETCLTNGYLDRTIIDWIPGMNDIRLKDLPSFIRTTDPNDIMLNFLISEAQRAPRASAVIINTVDALEKKALDSLSSFLPPLYTVGPLNLLVNRVSDDRLKRMESSLWKEEPNCIKWLDSKKPDSVLFVNFGSITVMTTNQLTEFAWGLANSNKDFLWVIRPDLVAGDSAILPAEFLAETRGRGMLASWCPQEQVLKHVAVAGFLTHSGWNSTIESLCAGVPVICWPFFAEQPTNCLYSCREWGIGLEIDCDVKRDEVEKLVRELMEGEKGREMKRKVVEWKEVAEAAASAPCGSSFVNLDKLVCEVLLPHL